MKKKGQQVMGMSYGMIFALILIAIFIVMAFMGIKSFLSFGRTSSVGLFYNELQEEINDVWMSQSSADHFKIDLPEGVRKVCFANLSAKITNQGEEYELIKDFFIYEANLFLFPPGASEGMEWKLMDHIDIGRITAKNNPNCIDVGNGLTIRKDFYDKLVWIE